MAAEEPIFTNLNSLDLEDEVPSAPTPSGSFSSPAEVSPEPPSTGFSGQLSVEIRDLPGDGDFPELQGYFDARSSGGLFVHFALLVTDPTESFNIAVAGPRGFHLGVDGIAFWLESRDGVLYQTAGAEPRPLTRLEAFHLVPGRSAARPRSQPLRSVVVPRG